jgi:pimeloyl-ACP methyl ester carboxylesterase
LAHLGHPILGDLRYGAGTPLPDRQIALLAHSLSVDHPTRNNRLLLTSPIPLQWPWPYEEWSDCPRAPWDWRVFETTIDSTENI